MVCFNMFLMVWLYVNLGVQAQDIIDSEGRQGPQTISLNRATQDRFLYKRAWNWREDVPQTLYIRTDSGTISHAAVLPYFGNEGPAAILNTGADRDINPEDGWTLLYKDFGAPGAGAVMPNFILYNKYRGLLRFFFYNTRLSDFSYCRVSVSQPDAAKASPLFNLGEPRTFLDTFDASLSPLTITEVAWWQWSFVDFQVTGYDPSPATDAALWFEITGVSEADVSISGGVSLGQVIDTANMGGKTFNIGNGFSAANKYFNGAGKAQAQLNKVFGKNPNTWFANYLKPLVVGDFANLVAGISGGIGFFSSIIFGGKENAVQPLNFKGELDLSGTITQTSLVYTLLLRLPGAPLSDPNDSAQPCSNTKLGIFNLNQPTWVGSVDVDCFYDDNVGNYTCEYEEQISLNGPLNVLVNPVIRDQVSVRAGRLKNGAVTPFYPVAGFHNRTYSSFWIDGNNPEWHQEIALELTIDYSSTEEPIVMATSFTPKFTSN